MSAPAPTAPACPHCGTPEPVLHSRTRTRAGPIQRHRCSGCRHTFSQRTSTPYHRLRCRQSEFDQAVHMVAEGSSLATVARVLERSAGTISRWMRRAGEFARAYQERTVTRVPATEVQVDELRGYLEDRETTAWVRSAIEVSSRLWTSVQISRRTWRSTRLFFVGLRDRLDLEHCRPLITTDSFKYNEECIRKTMEARCLHAQVEKQVRGNRVVRVDRKLVLGSKDDLDTFFSNSEDSKKINTSYIERLNLFKRNSCAALRRKTSCAAKVADALLGRVEISRLYYNFVRPHSSLRFGKKCRTPAQQAGLADRPLRWREVFMTPLPPESRPGVASRAR